MTISYFELLTYTFTKNLTNVKSILTKGWLHAQETHLSEVDFLNQRLAPDMFPLVKQIQIATDNAKGVLARLAGVDALKLADDETTIAALQSRIDTVLKHIQSFTPEQFTDAATRHIVLPYMPGRYQLGADYLKDYALPNFMFHVAMTYAIVRAQGVAIGKNDYIGGLSLHDEA